MIYKKEFYKDTPINFAVFEIILFLILGILLNMLFSSIDFIKTYPYLSSTLSKSVLGFIALILLFRLKLDYKNFLKSKNLFLSFKLGSFIILSGFLQFIIYIYLNLSNSINILLSSLIGGIIYSFTIGFYEETLMRGIILKNLCNTYKDDKTGVYKALIISSVLFGLSHLINLTSAPLLDTLIQVFYSTTAGILFGSIYIKSHNLLGIILLHSIYNLFTYITVNLYYTNFISYSLSSNSFIYIFYNVFLIFGNLIVGILVIKSKI